MAMFVLVWSQISVFILFFYLPSLTTGWIVLLLLHTLNKCSCKYLWVELFKNGPSKICGKQPITNLK